MQILSNSRRLSRVLKSLVSPIAADHHFVSSPSQIVTFLSSIQLGISETSSRSFYSSGFSHFRIPSQPTNSMIGRASFSVSAQTVNATETVKEVYEKMLESVNVKRSMPPNAWLWSLIENCQNEDDIKLLFDILQNVRRFRLSNLRIHDNFNCHLCREITKACTHAGAINFGKKTLWKHNVYGLTPNIASAHHLLSYAQTNKDVKLLEDIMKSIKLNDLPLQPGTADIVFRICHDTDDWESISKYAKKFAKAGVKFRKTTFDTWMEFAARRGDAESLWTIDNLRSETYKQHTLASAFSCAKGFLLEHRPEEAAAVILAVYQSLPDDKKLRITSELEKLVKNWPVDVVKSQKDGDGKELAVSLRSSVSAMVTNLVAMGLHVSVNLEDLNNNQAVPC